MKILVMGLPGSGKTYLTERLVPLISAAWYNADIALKVLILVHLLIMQLFPLNSGWGFA